MSVHLNLRNGKIRTDDKEDIVQTAAPAAQETAAQTSADYERQVRLNLKKGTVSYGGKSYGLSHEGTSNAGSQALQERIDARSREQKARTGNIWQAQSQTANRQSTEARQEETARQKVITMLAAGAAGLGSRSTGSARGTASSYLQGGGSTGGSAYAAALSAPAGRTQRYVSGREQLGQDILNLNRRQDAEQALGSRVMSDTARTDTLEQAARDTVIDAMVRQAQAGGQTQADKARAFDQVNAWLDENPEAKTLWDAERGAGRGNPAAQRAAQRIRAGMSEEEERAYEQAGELYDSYGSAWSAAHRLGSDVKGLAQQAAGSWATLAESIAPATRDEAANNSAERHALAELRRLTDEGKVFETDENGQIRTSDEYEAALARYNAAKEAGPQDNQKTVLTDENSAGMRLYHEGGENLAKAQAGLGSAARFGADTANAIAGNLPNMALALIPGVGPAVSLGALGAQAAGGRMAELYDEDTGADEALWRGLVSGGIEVGTEVLPVGSWVEIVNRGGKGLVRNLLQQMGEEGTEEAVGYVVNYLADVAAKDPNAEFSWEELAQNAGMGAISGGFYGAAGTGLNLALNRANTRMAENLAGGENQVQQANTRTAQAVREAALTQAQDMQQAVADPLGAAARLEEETRPGSTAAEEKYAPQAAQSAQESAQNADGELAARQAENAAKAAADALAQEKAAQDADTLTGEEAAQRADAQAVSEAALAQAAAERYAQESAPQADTVALERGTVRRETVEGIQAFADAEESYTPYMKKALVERYKGQSPAVYVQEMHSMYNAGREGVLSFEQAKSASAARAAVVQDDAALYTAYSLGRNAASALTVQQPAAAVTEPEVRYDGVPAGSAQVPDAVLQGVAEKFGMNVDVVRQLTADNGGEVNGYWAAGAAALTVGENSANAYQTVQHELTHWMEGENPEGWARLRARTMAFAASEYGLGGVQQHIGRYESSYGDRTQAADEYARDLFAGIMSSEENTRAFVEYVSEDSETTREEKRSVLQALREMLDKIVGSIRSLLRGGDATLGAADGRRLAERAENAEKARAVCDEALAELETARRNARARLEAAGQADSDTKNAPAASEGVKLSKNEQSGKKDFREDKYYRRQVEQWQSLKPGSRVKVGTVQEGSALNQVGFAAADVYFDASKLQKELTNHGDHLTAELVQRIPELLNDPIAITQAMTLKNTVNVFGDLQTADGTPVLVGVMVAKDRSGRNSVTKIRTIHARSDFAKLITDESILYLNENKKKTKEWFQVRGNRVPLEGTSFGLIRSIQLGDADVKYSEKISGAVTQEELEKAQAEYREAERALKDSWAREKAWRQQDEAEHGRFLARLMQHKRAGDAVQWKQSQEYLEYKAAENRFKAEQDALLEQRVLAQEVIKQAREQEQDKAWQKKQAQQAEYDAEVRESGMSREDYHREQAADTYGTTKWFESAGYILPDGRMLDFSGGSDKSVRDLDHRDIQSVYGPAELARGAEQTDYLNAFIAEGNVRVMAESPGVDVSAETEVSDAQKAAIAEMADTLGAAKHGFNLDISRKDGSTAATRWYEGRVRGSEVVRDLETYYRTGSLPEQSELNRFRYSKKVDAEKHPQRRKTGEEQVSFETLRELPDMEITEVEENDLADKPVKEILDAGLASTQRIPGKNSGSVVNRYTGDTIVVTRAGLRHGLLNAAQIQKNAPYVGQIGPILENAVKVNELEARGKEVRSDLYLGAARMSDGSLMGVRFVVNMYEDGQKVLDADSMEPLRGSLYAHTGRQIKNGTESLKGREVSTNAVALYGSNISIEDFLGSVKEELGENLSANVKYAFGMDMETLALDLANEAVEGYLNSPTRRTMADRAAQDAQKAARAEYRKGRRDAQAEMKALYDQAYANRKERFDAMLEVYKQKAQNAKDDAVMRERMQKLKWVQTRDKKLVRQQAEFATRMQRRNDGLLYRKSRDSAQKQVRTLAAWLREPTDTKHVPKKMRTAVLNVLNLFDWNTSNAGTATAQRWQETMKDIALMAKDAEALEHMGAGAGDYADFDPSLPGYIDTLLQQTGGKTGIGQFSGEQMRQLDVILKSMTKSITQANKLLAEGSRETIAAAGDASVAEMAAREKQQVKNKNNLLGKAVKAAADTTAGDALGQLLGVDMMDAGRYFAALGDTAEQMYRPIREGFDKRAWKLRETVEWTQALLKDKTDVDKWTGRKAEKRKFTVTDAASMADTVLELTPGQAMELYCLSQRAAAKEHLMIGGIQLKDAKGKPGRRVKLTPGQLAEITGSLTTEQVQTARAMQEYLSTTAAAWGNEVSNTLYGYDKFTETHYWPMSSSNDFTATTAASSRQAGLNGIKNAGMTKALVKGANNPLVVGDAFDTFFGHTTEMATYYGWCIPLSDMMKWYNWRAPESAVSVKEGIDNLLGRKGKDYFETLMRDINGQGRAETASGGERLMNTVTRNWKVAKVGANLRVAVQQPTAYFRAGAEIAPKYLRGALGRGAANLGKGLAARAKGQTFEGGMAKAEKYCAIAWWKSQGYFETNLGKDVRAMALDEETALERVRSASTAMAEWGDKTTWGALWNACELETLDKHPELEYDSEEFNRQCAARLSEIVDKTQVVDSVLHRSQIMRSTATFTKMVTNFMAEPIKSYAMVAQAAVNLAQNPKDKAARARFARVGVTYVATAMATAAAAAAVDTLRHPRGDDEDDDERLTAASLAKVYAQNVLENFADGVNLPGNLPLLQDVIGYITERADGNATYTIKRNDVEWIGDVMDAVSVWNKYLTGKTTSLYQVLYRTANAVSNVTGVAVSAALRDVKGVYDTLTGLAGADDPLGMDKDLNRIALALDGGDADKASRLFAGQVDAKVKSGTDPADAVTAARSTVTKLYSKAYQQADSEERAEMLDALMGLEYGGERVYDLDTVTGWGVTVGSADITAALDTADADAVQEMIDERVRQLERADEEAATQASRMMEAGTLTREEYDSVLDSARDAKELRTAIRSAITKEMKPRYQAADTAGRQEIAEMLCRLKVDGLTVYEADDFKKWE